MLRRVHAARALAVALALLPMAMVQAPAGARPGATVISIGDGDTIRVRMNGKPIIVRLACIDAPETAQRPHG
jgi:endonuclease YncB( thermonuclease family)